jgi:hypothetical protein
MDERGGKATAESVKCVSQIPGVPQLYVHSTGIALEIPTEAQRQEAVCCTLRIVA